MLPKKLESITQLNKKSNNTVKEKNMTFSISSEDYSKNNEETIERRKNKVYLILQKITNVKATN